MDLSHEEADVDQIEALEMLPGYKGSSGEERLALNQTLNLLRRENDLEARGVAVSLLTAVLRKKREGTLQFHLSLLSCLQCGSGASSLNLLEFSAPSA